MIHVRPDNQLLMSSILLYLFIGGCGGFLAGLFGIGGGVIIVPLLALAFHLQGVAPDLILRLAIGTSLACIAATAVSSAWAHHQRGAVRGAWLLRLLPGLVVGAVVGVFIGDALPADLMQTLLAIFFILVAIRLWVSSQPSAGAAMPGAWGMGLAGLVIGTVSALFGVGGGALTVPYLSWRGAAMTQAVGTSAAAGLPIAIIGGATSVAVGLGTPGLPPWTTGYVNWAAFAGLVVMSVPMARLGAVLAHRLPSVMLRRLFAVLLLLVALKMLF